MFALKHPRIRGHRACIPPALTFRPVKRLLCTLCPPAAALRHESEAEVQLFLRGSLAAAPASHPPQQHLPPRQQAAPAAPAARAREVPGRPVSQHSLRPLGEPRGEGPPAQAATSPVESSCGSPAGPHPEPGGVPASLQIGSLDLAAILGSRPPSPGKLATTVGYDCEGELEEDEEGEGPWQTARSGGRDGANSGHANGWQTARSEAAGGHTTAREHLPQLHLGGGGDPALWSGSNDEWQSETAGTAATAALRSLLASPGAQQRRRYDHGLEPSRESEAVSAGSAAGNSRGSSRGGLAEGVQQGSPALAAERPQALDAQLSPGSEQQQQSEGSPTAGSQAGTSCRASPDPQQQQQHALHSTSGGSGASSSASGSSRLGPPRERHQEPASCASSVGARQEAPPAAGAPLPQRQASPELPGLGISRRQARLLQVTIAAQRASLRADRLLPRGLPRPASTSRSCRTFPWPGYLLLRYHSPPH